MDEFKLPIDKEKFRLTNAPWNELKLNHPWSVGYVSMLIELKSFKNKEEWEAFYYEMGNYRLKKMKELNSTLKNILNDACLEIKYINKLPKNIIAINKQNGRTENQLLKKGEILHHFINKKHPNITLNECVEAVKFRVIGETWNGIILREHNTITTLKNELPNLNFIKKEGEFDYNYAIDYEISFNNKLLCGIQIKPKSYTYNTTYILKAKRTNYKKNRKYQNKYNVPFFDIISTTKGEIINLTVVNKIKKLL